MLETLYIVVGLYYAGKHYFSLEEFTKINRGEESLTSLWMLGGLVHVLIWPVFLGIRKRG